MAYASMREFIVASGFSMSDLDFNGDLYRLLNQPYRFKTESPIEERLVYRLLEAFPYRHIPEVWEDQGRVEVYWDSGPTYLLQTQVPIGRYRADILLTQVVGDDAEGAHPARIVVECDGAQWHSSPEQITRDRERDLFMDRNDFLVRRYWGRDIWHCTDAVAQQIVDLARDLAWGAW